MVPFPFRTEYARAWNRDALTEVLRKALDNLIEGVDRV